MNRRSFLLAPAATALAGAAERNQIRLGVASYSLRKKSLAEAVKALQQLEIRYFKMKSEAHLPLNSTPEQIRAAKRLLDAAGVVLESTGNNPLQRDEAEIRAKFAFNKQLGIKLMIVAPTMATLPAVERCVKEFDIRAAIHNHGPEDKHFPTPSSVLKAIRSMDPRMGLCLDVGHTARTGEDFVAAIAAAGPRLFDVDVKDLRSASRKDSECDVGEGALPIAMMFRELQRTRYSGIVHLEYEINEDNPVPGMQKSFAYMRGVLAGINVA
jgi:sugar phosphate isomerase/epimerase